MTVYVFILIAVIGTCYSEERVWKKFEYKYSITAPHPPEVTNRALRRIPFWETYGNIIGTVDNIRLTPSLPNWRGALWHKNQTTFEWWEVGVIVGISGRGKTGGGSMAFWFTEQKHGNDTKSIYGAPDLFKGLGIVFEHDDQIMVLLNDGTAALNKESITQKHGCVKKFRNTPFPFKFRVRLFNGVLTLHHNGGLNNGHIEADYELCFRVENISLPKFGYFGISAATFDHHLSDDHDLMTLSSFSLTDKDEKSELTETLKDDNELGDEEIQRYEKELSEHEEHFQKQKEEYLKDHPGHASHDQDENADIKYEDAYEEVLNSIFNEQSLTVQDLRGLMTKIGGKLLEQTDSITSAIGTYQKGSTHSTTNIIQRHDIDSIQKDNQELVVLIAEINLISAVLSEKMELDLKQPRGDTAELSDNYYSSEIQQMTRVIEDLQNKMKTMLHEMSVKLFQGNDIPFSKSNERCTCVSTKSYVIFSFVSTFIILAYMMYNNEKGTIFKSKKYY